MSSNVGHAVDRVAGHFACAKFLALTGLVAFRLHGEPELDSRRVASESFSLSCCCLADVPIVARKDGSARKPIIGLTPVGGRPRFCLADIAFYFFV
jgi:hypothetical protein